MILNAVLGMFDHFLMKMYALVCTVLGIDCVLGTEAFWWEKHHQIIRLAVRSVPK